MSVIFFFFRDQLGEALYAEYTLSSLNIKKEITKQFKFYSENPSAHPQFEALSKKFASSVNNSVTGSSDLSSLWSNFWPNYFSALKEQTLQKELNKLQEKFIKKSEENKFLASKSICESINQNFNVKGTFELIEKLHKSLGAIGLALISMITKCRELGTITPKALAVFTDEENILFLNLALEKLEGLKQKSEGNLRVQYDTSIVAIKHLMQFAEEKCQFRKGIDTETIAKATIGKDSTYIIKMIKTACMYEGDLNPSQERVSELYMDIRNAHLKLMP